jgi:hypothetical protein
MVVVFNDAYRIVGKVSFKISRSDSYILKTEQKQEHFYRTVAADLVPLAALNSVIILTCNFESTPLEHYSLEVLKL